MSDSPDAADRAEAPAPAPVAADVGIVAALGIEVGFLVDRLTKVRKYAGHRHAVVEGELGGKLVALLIAGPGRASAARGTDLLLAGHRPRWIVSAGFGGGLSPSYQRGQIVLADEVIDLEGHRFTVDVSAPGGTVVTGRLLTVDSIVRTAAEKAELRARFAADVVDMETSGVAAVCAARSVRFLSVRVISDEAGGDLPPEVVALLTRSGSYRVGAALRAIWHRPSSLKDFLALHGQANEAADRLAEFVAGAVARLD